MIKIEANTLKEAYEQAARELACSAKELKVEVVQKSSPGVFGLFKKKAIIVAAKDTTKKKKDVEFDVKEELAAAKKLQKKSPKKEQQSKQIKKDKQENQEKQEKKEKPKPKKEKVKKQENIELSATPEPKQAKKPKPKQEKQKSKKKKQDLLNDTIMPTSFVSSQEDDEYDEELSSGVSYTADYDDAYDNNENHNNMDDIAKEIAEDINTLFDLTCFDMKKIKVGAYDENTILIEFQGDDSALMIGKEGYRYKALSYMLYNWINAKYDVQLRLEIAEFLKNQEESVDRYLTNVYENVEKDGRAQTKILDGVLIQIALRKLREVYPDKYVVIRSTRDGQKYIIVNDYHSN